MKCHVWNCRKQAVAKSFLGPVCKKHFFESSKTSFEPSPKKVTSDWSGFIEADRKAGRTVTLD